MQKIIPNGIAAILFFLCHICSTVAIAQENTGTLFEGEMIEEAEGFPAIYKFIAGDKTKPLLVFVPGAHHTARVFYGGHQGSKAENFVSHWVNAKGYNFLALSYPIATSDPAIGSNHPQFMIRDWGKQVAALTKKTIEQYELENRVIVVAWSMGGKIVQSVYEAMQSNGVNLDFYTALTATPPIPGMIAVSREYPMLESGYADRRKNFAGWFKQVAAQGEREGQEIVPESVYMSQYVGDITINQQGYGQQYRDGQYVMDHMASQQDSQAFNFANFPLVGIIAPDGRGDKRHAIVDQASWTIYNANTIYKRYIAGNKVDVNKLTDADWKGVLDLTRNIGSSLFTSVDGNHFFFMGESGARATADAIEQLENKVQMVKKDLASLLGVEIK